MVNAVLLCEIFLFILAAFAGTCIFSFLNVVIYRVPKGEDFVKGFSYCPSCGHRLGARDLVPIWSCLFLRGSCRYCGSRIGWRDTVVELFGGILAALCVFRMGWSLQSLWMFVFYGVLTVVALIDHDTMEIPDGCHFWILGIAVLSCLFPLETAPGLTERLIGMVCISAPMLLLTVMIQGAFGGGDIKLMAVCGLVLGWKQICVSMFLAVLMGGSYGIWLLVSKKKERKDHFAFGPFLCVGMLTATIWGPQLLGWYLGFFR